MPTAWWLRPVSSDARLGEHNAVTWKRLYRSPSAASRSIVGVAMSDPNVPSCAKPVSSRRTTTTFGDPAGFGRRGKPGVDSCTVRPTTACSPLPFISPRSPTADDCVEAEPRAQPTELATVRGARSVAL